MKKYQIQYSMTEERSSVMTFEELAVVSLTWAQENEFEMVAGKGEEWSRHIENGEKTENGFFLGDWKENLTDDEKLETCKSILSAFGDTVIEINKEEK